MPSTVFLGTRHRRLCPVTGPERKHPTVHTPHALMVRVNLKVPPLTSSIILGLLTLCIYLEGQLLNYQRLKVLSISCEPLSFLGFIVGQVEGVKCLLFRVNGSSVYYRLDDILGSGGRRIRLRDNKVSSLVPNVIKNDGSKTVSQDVRLYTGRERVENGNLKIHNISPLLVLPPLHFSQIVSLSRSLDQFQ